MGRPGCCVVQPPTSTVWHNWFQYPPQLPGSRRHRGEYPLKARDKSLAKEKSLPKIKDDLIFLLAMRKERNPFAERAVGDDPVSRDPDGEPRIDGLRIVAAEDILIAVRSDGPSETGDNIEIVAFPGQESPKPGLRFESRRTALSATIRSSAIHRG